MSGLSPLGRIRKIVESNYVYYLSTKALSQPGRYWDDEVTAGYAKQQIHEAFLRNDNGNAPLLKKYPGGRRVFKHSILQCDSKGTPAPLFSFSPGECIDLRQLADAVRRTLPNCPDTNRTGIFYPIIGVENASVLEQVARGMSNARERNGEKLPAGLRWLAINELFEFHKEEILAGEREWELGPVNTEKFSYVLTRMNEKRRAYVIARNIKQRHAIDIFQTLGEIGFDIF